MLIFFTAAFFSQSAKAQSEAQKIELCTKITGGANYLNGYPVLLPGTRDGERPQSFKQAIGLKKGNKYRLTICTDEDSSGEAVLQILDEGRSIGSSQLPDGRMIQNFDFDCNKTAAYVIIVTFKDGKEGSAVFILSHVKTL